MRLGRSQVEGQREAPTRSARLAMALPLAGRARVRPVLRGIHRHEALDGLRCVKPQRRAQMREIEGPRRDDGRQNVRIEVERDIAEHEPCLVPLDPFDAHLVMAG